MREEALAAHHRIPVGSSGALNADEAGTLAAEAGGEAGAAMPAADPAPGADAVPRSIESIFDTFDTDDGLLYDTIGNGDRSITLEGLEAYAVDTSDGAETPGR